MRPAVSGCISILVMFLFCSGCGGGSSADPPGAALPGSGTVPLLGHVVLVVEENHSYSQVIGSSVMPYLNSLVPRAGSATQYYANLHNSLPNYFELTVGETIATDDLYTGTVTQDNIVRELTAAGKTWKSYAENLPSPASTGVGVPPYAKDHNPFAYFSDVLNSSTQAANLVDFTQFSTDLANGSLPNFSFLLPNNLDNGHDCPPALSTCTDNQKLAFIDSWLQTNIDPILQNPQFQQDGLLIITFDESSIDDLQLGGGHIPFLVLGPRVRAGSQLSTIFQHQSTLRLMLEAQGIKTWPGMAATAPSMAGFFH